ncbi:MAG: hypothetical protein GQ574_08750 [Crocinitomix sp.]|nr:hypothetical protein [Crocinitomix sp.]
MEIFYRTDPKGSDNEEKPKPNTDGDDAGSSYETFGEDGSDNTNKRK